MIARGVLIFWTLMGLLLAAPPGESTLLDTGYRQMYNLQFEQAHQTFHAYEAQHPEDPMGPVSNAAAFLFAEFDRLNILQGEFFTNDNNFKTTVKLVPDPKIKQSFESDLAHAEALIKSALAKNAEDANAAFADLLRMGLHADYLALIEKRYLAALSEIKGSRARAESLLAKNPGLYDAYLAIGVENYLLSLKPAPVRWFLRMNGAQTDKDLGVERLRITAEKGRYLKPYARLMLGVAALRDGDKAKARSILAELSREFPQNRLYIQELNRLR